MNQSQLKELFEYKDGNLIWKVKRGTRGKKGSIAGYTNIKNGYIDIKINNTVYKMHRLVWIYHFGNIPNELVIDHIDRIRNNNYIENLRLVTRQENSFNNSSLGYSYHKRDKVYQARITINKTVLQLGYFNTKEEARGAYLKAKQELHIIKEREN